VRTGYEGALAAAESGVLAAAAQGDDAATALALERSELLRFKLSMDEARLTTHGALLAALKSKTEAEAFFRGTSAAPGEDKAQPAAPEPVAPPA
jgi:hypothetical protein